MATKKKDREIYFFGLNVESKVTPYVLLGFVILLWSLCWILISTTSALDVWEKRGQFGDMFGAVNALFSGLAFAGIILTILLQREELKAQREELILSRKELELTRGELAGQKKELKKQNENLKHQRYNDTYLQLLNLHVNEVKALEYNGAAGVKVFEKLTEELTEELIRQNMFEWSVDGNKDYKITKLYMEYLRPRYYVVSQYLESLAGIHGYIDNNYSLTFNEFFSYLWML